MGQIEQIAGRGYTIFMIEHDMRFVMGLCERVAVLNFGRIIAEGSPAEIQQQSGRDRGLPGPRRRRVDCTGVRRGRGGAVSRAVRLHARQGAGVAP